MLFHWWIRWNQWYDRLEEPFRITILLSMVILCFVVQYIISLFYDYIWLDSIGVIIVGIIGIGRWYYLIRGRKK